MIPATAPGPLRAYSDAGLLEPADVHVARTLGRLVQEHDDELLLAVALTVRAVRNGSVCLDLTRFDQELAALVEEAAAEAGAEAGLGDGVGAVGPVGAIELDWPSDLATRLARSPLVAGEAPALRLECEGGSDLLYLDRYWRQESFIAAAVDERRARAARQVDQARLEGAVARLFPASEPDRQRLAAVTAAQRSICVLAGGPGTGKTVTVARLLAVLADQPGPPPRIALAAPTGKAAARLEEAVRQEVARLTPVDQERLGGLHASTSHRLLGWRPGARTRFLHDADHPLPYDVIVVDEASMISLTLMARLLEAVSATARLVLVGDPDQLASVEAGAVLGDLVRRPAPASATALPWVPAVDRGELPDGDLTAGVVTLSRVYRSDQGITEVAAAIRSGDADAVLGLLEGDGPVRLVSAADAEDGGDGSVRERVVTVGYALQSAAAAGDARAALAALEQHRVLCAHLRGPYGVAAWTPRVERWLAGVGPSLHTQWYAGRPLLVTANDPVLGLFNGDTGVVVMVDGRPTAVFPAAHEPRLIPINRLGEVTTVHAMTVHKSQGSEFDSVTLVLPEVGSPLLTRELLYTGLTRARYRVTIVGAEEAIREAVATRVNRASGLAQRRS